jgi:hypothetical protein
LSLTSILIVAEQCPDPEVIIGQGRALFRLADLLELASLVSRLTHGERSGDV